MTSNETLRKAEIALDVILKLDEENSNCSFRQVLDEIIDKWKDLKKEVEGVNGFESQTQPTTSEPTEGGVCFLDDKNR